MTARPPIRSPARSLASRENSFSAAALAELQKDPDESRLPLIEKAKSTDVDKVIAAMAGQTFKAPSGFTATMDAKNHHLHKPVFIGEVKADGQFNVVWKTPGPIKAKPWSPYIEGNDKKKDEPDGKSKV